MTLTKNDVVELIQSDLGLPSRAVLTNPIRRDRRIPDRISQNCPGVRR